MWSYCAQGQAIAAAVGDFSAANNASRFQFNGDAVLNSTDVRLTRDVTGVFGTAFSKRRILLPTDRSFSAYFTF